MFGLISLLPGLGKLLTGIPGVAEGLIGYLNKRADVASVANTTNVTADKEVNLAVIQAHLEEQKLVSAQRAADRGSLWTAWMMPTAFAVSLTHYAAVVFDSMPFFGHAIGSWHIAALPAAQDTLQSSIILTGVGLAAGKSLVGRIFSK